MAHKVIAENNSIFKELYGKEFYVNSAHHHGIKRLATDLKPTLYYENIIEGYEHISKPYIGVQWHPERMCLDLKREDTVNGLKIFEHFIEQCKIYKGASMVNEKIIDTHLHIEAWENEEFDFINCFEKYRRESNLASFNVCALPSHNRVGNNIMCAFYKLVNKNTFAHGGVEHINFPISENMPKGMDLITQYEELMEIGFDGIKMLEGKPPYLKKLGNNLLAPSLLRLFERMEKDQVHIVLHSNDPSEWWDKDKISKDFYDMGWFYGDGTYLTSEEIYNQTEAVLEKFPKLKLTLAHFYFCSKNPQRLEALFEKYPNLCIDITPGCEMYHDFEANHEYYKSFFEKHSKRILVGTDATFPMLNKCHTWCIDRLYRFIATDDEMMAFDDSILTGIKLPTNAKEDILYKNYESRVSEQPKPINKNALRAYIEKYKDYIFPEERERIEALCKKYL